MVPWWPEDVTEQQLTHMECFMRHISSPLALLFAYHPSQSDMGMLGWGWTNVCMRVSKRIVTAGQKPTHLEQ